MERSEHVIVVPCFNEEKTIEKQIAALARISDVIIVDDGSTDSSRSTLSKLQMELNNVHVLTHEVNLGYSKSIADGIGFALSREYQLIVTTDADGEISPLIIPIIFEELKKGFDIVFGVRNRITRLAEKITVAFAFLMWRIRDPLCGLKGYRAEALKQLDHLYTYNSLGTEILYAFLVKDRKFSSIDIDILHREDHSRIGNMFTANIKIFLALIQSIKFVYKLKKGKK